MSQIQRKQWWQILRLFYIKEANRIVSRQQRNLCLGTFLVMFENFFLVLCSLLRHEDASLKSLDPNLYFGIHQAKSAFDFNQSQLKVFLTVIMGLNLIIICLIFIFLILLAQKNYNKQSQEYQEQLLKEKGKKQNPQTNLQDLIMPTLSLLTSCYRQVVFPVGMFVSYLAISDPRGIITLLLTFSLGIAVTDSDFSYIHFSKDTLAKPHHSSKFIILVFEGFTFLSIVHFSETVSLIISLIFFIFKLITETTITSYWNYSMKSLNCCVLLISIIATTFFFLGFHSFNADQLSVSLLLLVIDLPFSVVLTWGFMRFQQKTMNIELQNLIKNQDSPIECSQTAQNYELEKLDRILRNNPIFQPGDSLRQQENHAIFLYSTLSLEWLDNNQHQTIDVFNMHEAKQELINTIAKRFEAATKGKDEIPDMHLYLSFLLSIQGNYRLFWLNSHKSKRNQRIPLKNQQLIYSICRHFKAYKTELQEKIQRIAIQEKDNTQIKADSFELFQSLNPFYEGFLNVLDFEEHINISYSLITQASKLKLDLLELMKSRFINSKLLSEQIDILEEKLTKIRQHIRRAYLINSRSAKVADLQVIFMKSLAFTADEKVLKRTRNLNGTSGKFDEELSQYHGDLKMFSRNQCIVFASLEESFELKTVQVSGNFSRLFRCDPRDILNEQTTRLMPRVFQNVHHTYVKKYLTSTEGQLAIEQDINTLDKQDTHSSEDVLLRMKDKLIFAALKNDKSGLLITPIQVEVKLNTLNKTQHLGFSARLKVLNNGQDYILFSANTLQTRGVTENLFNLLANVSREFCSSSEKFNLKLLFPFLSSVQDCNMTGKNTIQQWKDRHKSRFQALSTCYIVLFKNTMYSQQRDQRYNSTNYISQAKVNCNTESLPINQITSRTGQKQFSYQDIMEINSPIASKNTTIQDNFQRAQTYQSTQHENQWKNEYQQEDSCSSFRSKDSVSCQVFQVDMQLIDVNYSGLEEIFAISITKIKQLKSGESQQEASNQIQQYYSIYTQFYPQQQLQLFIKNSSQSLRGFYDKYNSLNNQIISPKSGSQIGSPINISQIQDKAQYFHFFTENNDSSRNQNGVQSSTYSPVQSKIKEDQYLFQTQNYNKINSQQIQRKDKNISSENIILLSQASKRSNTSLLKYNDSVLAMSSSKPLMLASFNINSCDDTHEMLQQLTISPVSTQRIRLNNNTISEEPEEQQQQYIVNQDLYEDHGTEQKRGKYIPDSQGEIKLRLDQKYKKKISFKNQKSQYYNNNSPIDQSDYEIKNIFRQGSDEDNEDEDEEGVTEKKQQNEKDLLAEIESHRSKASSTASLSQLKNYVKLLSGKEKSQAILIINYIGYLCYLVMAGLTVLTYISVDSQMTSSFYDNSYSIWPMKYSWIMFNIFTNQNVQILVNQGDLNTAGSLPTPASKLSYVTQTQLEAPEILQTWKMLVAEQFRVGTKRGVFQYFLNHTNAFQIELLYNSTLIKGTNSVPSGFPVLQHNETVLTSGVYMMPMLARYITGLVERSEYYVITNSMNIVAALKLILNDIQSQYDYSNSYIQSNLIQSMVVVIVMSFICMILLIPLDIFIQFRRDRIIELFSSFSINEIDSMVQQIHSSLLGSRNIMKSVKNLPQVTKKIVDPKRQPLGNTSPLPKLNLRLIFIVVIGYALILTGPILNQVFTQTYIEQTKYLYTNKGKIYEIKAHSSQIMQINYQCLILKIRPASKPVPLSLMLNKAISKNGLIQYYTDFLATIIEDQENLINVHEDFRNFFFAAIEHDICKAFTDYPQYTTSKMKTLLPSCKTLKQGILQQGFSISMRTFYAIFPTFNSFYTTPTANIPTFLNQINSSFDLKEFTDFNQFLEEVIESLGNFIVIQYQNKFDFIRNLQLGIMVYQLAIMSLMFLVGWSRFASHLNQQFARTQQQLRVLNINALVENSYVIAYFKKHNRT